MAASKNGRSVMVNLRVPHELLLDLQTKATARGMPYQALLKQLVRDGLQTLPDVPARSASLPPPSEERPPVTDELLRGVHTQGPPAESAEEGVHRPQPVGVSVTSEGEPLSVPAEPSDEEPEAAHEEEGSHAPGREAVTPEVPTPTEEETPWDFLDSV